MLNLKSAIRLPRARPAHRKQRKYGLPLDQQRVQKLSELGARLRAAREAQDIPLEQVAAQTKIQQRLLRAIEQGQMDQLPEPVYVQGFIKRFAEALGLDGTELSLEFPTGIAPKFNGSSWRTLPAAQLRPLHLYLFYIALIIGAVNGLANVVDRTPAQSSRDIEIEQPFSQTTASHNRRTNRPAPPASAKVALPSATAPAAGQAVKSTAGLNQILPFLTSPNQGEEPVQVSVTLKTQSWLRVVSDGKLTFEGVLSEGTQRTWTAQEKIILRAGNAGGVLVTFNNGQVKPMGPPGSVEEVTFEAKQQATHVGEMFLSSRPGGAQ